MKKNQAEQRKSETDMVADRLYANMNAEKDEKLQEAEIKVEKDKKKKHANDLNAMIKER